MHPDSRAEPRWLAPLFIALVVLHLIPIWAALFVPTADGPSHLYNAWVIKEILQGDAGIIERAYRIDWRPHPNWLGHAIMAALMFVVRPLVAEKLLFSLIIILFLGGAWKLCDAVDRRSRAYAFLAFPFAYHQLLQTGFYNFSLSLGLHLIILAVWWRRRDEPTARTIALIALLLVLCYFSHPMSAVLVIGSLGLLWLMTLHGRRLATHARHIIAIVPVLPLLVWFVGHRAAETVVEPWPGLQLFKYLYQAEILVTYSTATLFWARFLFGLYVLLILATIIREFRRREENAFGVVALALIFLYVFSPAAFAGGQLIRERLSLYIFLAPLPWFSPRLPRVVLNAVVLLLTVAAIAKGVYTIDRYRHYSAEVTEYVRSYAAVRPGSTVIPLLYTRDTPGAFTGVIGHAVGYAAIEKRLIDISNYEPRTGYFPVTYATDYKPPGVYWIEAKPADLDVAAYAPYGDFVLTWKMPDDAPVNSALADHYRLVDARGHARVYERKEASQFQAGERLERILLPIAGTPLGSAWTVDQTMRNTGAQTIRVGLTACPELPACEISVNPGESVRLVASPTDAPYIFVTVRATEADRLQFSTQVRRRDMSVPIPAVRSDDFRRKRIVIDGPRFREEDRLNLRLWTDGTSGAAELRVRAGGKEQSLLSDASGFYTHGDLASLFPGVRGRARIEIEVMDESALVWGFVTSTENATERVTVHLPATH